MKTKCLIVSGGDYSLLPNNFKADFVVAADFGYTHAIKLGRKPDLVIGDFDSLTIATDDVKTIKAPTNKAQTDTFLAASYALSQGYKKISLACALGGRYDHSIANIQTAVYIAKKTGICKIFGSNTRITVLCNRKKAFAKKEQRYFSVFAYNKKAKSVTITGAKYPLQNAVISPLFPVGQSNEIIAKFATVEVLNGILIVVQDLK